MINISHKGLLLLVSFYAFIMVACSNNDNEGVSEESLIGMWYSSYASNGNPCGYEFFSNHSGIHRYKDCEWSFTWTLNGSHIDVIYSDGETAISGAVIYIDSNYKMLINGENEMLIFFRSLQDCSGTDYNGETNQEGNSIPSSINGKYLHLYRSDGQKLVIQHLNSSGASIENQTFISYKNGYAPSYKYTKSSATAKYYLMWTPLTYIAGQSMETDKHYIEIVLSFNANDKTHGTFSGTTWIEGWNWNTNTEYRKNETKCTGKFYLGGMTDPQSENGDNSGSTDKNHGKVKSIEIISIDNITSNSADIVGNIDINGSYDEKGIVCIGFNHSLEAFAFRLPSNPSDFKAKYGGDCTQVKETKFTIRKSGLNSKKIYIVEAYAIIGDQLVRSESKSFKID